MAVHHRILNDWKGVGAKKKKICDVLNHVKLCQMMSHDNIFPNLDTVFQTFWKNPLFSAKGILWKNSIQKMKIADSVLLNLFMRDNGSCDIPHAAYIAPGWALLYSHKGCESYSPKGPEM